MTGGAPRLVSMTVAWCVNGSPLGAVTAHPQAERWKRDRKSIFLDFKVATDPATGIDDGGGLKRRVGSSEQIKTVMAGPNPGARARGLVNLCHRNRSHQRAVI
jgi:hypothetical protein